jgi:hypothetical protein
LTRETLPLADAGGWVKFLQRAAANRALYPTKNAFTEIFMPKKKRSDSNSTTAALAGFAGAMDKVAVPEGVQLRSDEEHTIWEQFTRARSKEDWRDLDLILLAKVVRMEADIREQQRVLDADGMTVENKRGTMVVNPLVAVIDTLERRQLAVIRSMSLNQQHSDPRTINAAAKTGTKARNVVKEVGVEGLIAMPLN